MIDRGKPDTLSTSPPPRASERPWMRPATILAQDPSLTRRGSPVFATIQIPAEDLASGPRGYRVHAIDYDATRNVLYPSLPEQTDQSKDPFDGATAAVLGDPSFHAWNTYALAMRTLARFEFALGRRVCWGFKGHVLKIAPHAFADPNAFFDPDKEALLFGYFTGSSGQTVHTALSHDIVVHETTHAILAGLRSRYLRPSSPDQAAFHEGFADVVALLSVFSLPEVVGLLLDSEKAAAETPRGMVRSSAVTRAQIRRSRLFDLAEQMGMELPGSPGRALRRSLLLAPEKVDFESEEYLEPHARGEVLVACVLTAFAEVWNQRLEALRKARPEYLDRERVAEEGAKAASHLLTMCVRALDYLPPAHVTFPDYLTALLTADGEIQPDDSKYAYRGHLIESFARFKIRPVTDSGIWSRPGGSPDLERSHFESLTRDPIEVFRFIWDNRTLLKLHPSAYTEVLSVRPCWRIAPDGFVLRETIAEYVQILKVQADELGKGALARIDPVEGLEPWMPIYLEGGTTLVFDEYGRLKFQVGTGVASESQSARLRYLNSMDALRASKPRFSFSALHRSKALGIPARRADVW